MTLISRLLAAYLRLGWRGRFRISNMLARRLKSLQRLPIIVEGGIVFADLRISSALSILAQPISQSGENRVMRELIRPGDVVLDIGAHLGFYTVLMSHLVGSSGKVLAFEPNSELLPMLRRTVANRENVELFEIALSDVEGDIDLFVPMDASMASLRDWTAGVSGSVHKVSCRVVPLNTLYRSAKVPLPTLIKCDVEGAELGVFRGADQILDRIDAPVLMFELNSKAASAFGSSTVEYFDFLESLDRPQYRFFEVTKDGLTQLTYKESNYSNVVAIPQQKLDERFDNHSNLQFGSIPT